LNYILNNHFRPDPKTESKFYWYLFCKKYNLNHPSVYIVKQNNIVYNYNSINQKNYYVIKSLKGCHGDGIIKLKGNKINSYVKKNNNIIIQEFLKDKFNNTFRSFRLVTTYDGDIFQIFMTTSKNNFVVNGAQGGTITHNIGINYYDSSKISTAEKHLLNKYINKLSNIHKNDYNNCISISWDLMFANNFNLFRLIPSSYRFEYFLTYAVVFRLMALVG